MTAKPLYDFTDDDGVDHVVWIKEERTEDAPHANNFRMKIRYADIIDNKTGEPLRRVTFASLRPRKSE